MRQKSRRWITLIFFIASLISWGLDVVVIFATPEIDWRTHALATSGALALFAFLGYYVFEKYVWWWLLRP